MLVKKIVAVAALGCALLASQAFAYEVGEYSKEALRRGDDKPVVVKDYPVVAIEDVVASPQLYTEKLIAVQGPIRYFVTGNIYEMQAENGTRLRANFGRYSRRLLFRTPFTAIGVMRKDDRGDFLLVKKVIWRDVNPYKEYFDAQNRTRPVYQESNKKVVNDRDPAFFHDPIVSDNKRFLQNNPKAFSAADLASYQTIEGKAFADGNLEVGTKVALMGRNIRTIKPDWMEFWDKNMTPVTLKMNNTYCPLGQRGTFFGTVQEENGKKYVSVDYFESIENWPQPPIAGAN